MNKQSQRFTHAVWEIMEKLLEEDSTEAALSGSLEILIKVMQSEAGAIWVLDKDSGRLYPMVHFGQADVGNISIENGEGTEGIVTKKGQSIRIENTADNPKYPGTIYDDVGMAVRTLLCVPLKALDETIGCIEIVNKINQDAFDMEEQKLLEHMAAMAALMNFLGLRQIKKLKLTDVND